MKYWKQRWYRPSLLIALIIALVAAAAPQGMTQAAPICVNPLGTDGCLATLQAAVDAAVSGDTISVAAGTYPLSSNVLVNKAVTISGAGADQTIFEVSGTGNRFTFTAAGAVLEKVTISKKDKTNQEIILLNANNVQLLNNVIQGMWAQGDGETTRAMVAAGSLTGLVIEGNTIHNLRQPAYINPGTHGSVRDNVLYETRGWVVDGALLDFENNSWGDGSKPNAVDIALLPGTASDYLAAYSDLPALSTANNNAVIEDQRVTPRLLSDVFVDDSAVAGGDGTKLKPYQQITPAITRAVVGGTINVAAGTYAEDVILNKAGVQLMGAGKDTTTIVGPKTGSSATLDFKANNVLVDGFTITRDGNNPTEWETNAKTSGVAIFDVSGVTLQNCEVTGNRNGVYFNGFNSANNTVKDNVITNNRTGINVFRGAAGNQVLNNEISSNWTFGVVFIPMADTTVSGFTFHFNRITGNWYGQVLDRNNSDTGTINFEKNWFGTWISSVDQNYIPEPAYKDQVPEQFGGTAKAPQASQLIIDPEAGFSTLDYAPWCANEACTKFVEQVTFLPTISR